MCFCSFIKALSISHSPSQTYIEYGMTEMNLTSNQSLATSTITIYNATMPVVLVKFNKLVDIDYRWTCHHDAPSSLFSVACHAFISLNLMDTQVLTGLRSNTNNKHMGRGSQSTRQQYYNSRSNNLTN